MKKILILALIMAAVQLTFADNKKDDKQTSDNKAKVEKTISIFGKVVDKNTGEELAGALVQVKGTNIYTYTDFGGNFSIKDMNASGNTIVVSYISYKDSEIKNLKSEFRNNSGIKVELESL